MSHHPPTVAVALSRAVDLLSDALDVLIVAGLELRTRGGNSAVLDALCKVLETVRAVVQTQQEPEVIYEAPFLQAHPENGGSL